MEKYFTPKLETTEDGIFKETVICFGEFEDCDDAYEAADNKNFHIVWSEEGMSDFNDKAALVIKVFKLENGVHHYFAEDAEDGSIHLIGNMECISEADEASQAMGIEVGNIYSAERLLNLNKQITEILAS